VALVVRCFEPVLNLGVPLDIPGNSIGCGIRRRKRVSRVGTFLIIYEVVGWNFSTSVIDDWFFSHFTLLQLAANDSSSSTEPAVVVCGSRLKLHRSENLIVLERAQLFEKAD
jgi:hypothetical protein